MRLYRRIDFFREFEWCQWYFAGWFCWLLFLWFFQSAQQPLTHHQFFYQASDFYGGIFVFHGNLSFRFFFSQQISCAGEKEHKVRSSFLLFRSRLRSAGFIFYPLLFINKVQGTYINARVVNTRYSQNHPGDTPTFRIETLLGLALGVVGEQIWLARLFPFSLTTSPQQKTGQRSWSINRHIYFFKEKKLKPR